MSDNGMLALSNFVIESRSCRTCLSQMFGNGICRAAIHLNKLAATRGKEMAASLEVQDAAR